MAELFDSRASFYLAALVVTWAAMTILTLIAVNLHVRLQRLERSDPATQAPQPYGRFLGMPVREVLGGDPSIEDAPRLLLFLSNDCPACERLLEELATGAWSAPAALMWTDAIPALQERLPQNTTLVADGPQISARLGIRVTPFAMVADDDERIVGAAPINRLPSLDALTEKALASPG